MSVSVFSKGPNGLRTIISTAKSLMDVHRIAKRLVKEGHTDIRVGGSPVGASPYDQWAIFAEGVDMKSI